MGLAVARGRAQAGLGSACPTADGPATAFTYRDQLTVHVESALAQIADSACVTFLPSGCLKRPYYLRYVSAFSVWLGSGCGLAASV